MSKWERERNSLLWSDIQSYAILRNSLLKWYSLRKYSSNLCNVPKSMHLHSKSSDETVKAYCILYKSVRYANPKYMFRKPELATPFSKIHSFLAVRNWFLLSKWHVTRQLAEECFPLSAGGWHCRSSCKEASQILNIKHSWRDVIKSWLPLLGAQ